MGVLLSCAVTLGLCSLTLVHPDLSASRTTLGRLENKMFVALFMRGDSRVKPDPPVARSPLPSHRIVRFDCCATGERARYWVGGCIFRRHGCMHHRRNRPRMYGYPDAGGIPQPHRGWDLSH